MFITMPTFSIGRKTDEWVLVTPLVYNDYEMVLTVPAGFKTDLASIPRLVRMFIPVNGKHRIAAIIHDYLYKNRGIFCAKSSFNVSEQINFTREESDVLFKNIMRELGVKRWRCEVMYLGVHLFGGLFW